MLEFTWSTIKGAKCAHTSLRLLTLILAYAIIFFSVLTRIKRGNFSSGELWNHKRKLVVHSLSVYMYLSEGGDKKKKSCFLGHTSLLMKKTGPLPVSA